MAKHIDDFIVCNSVKLTSKYQLLRLSAPENADLSTIVPGQFVQVKVGNNHANTFLRRPISIHDVDTANNSVSLLVCRAGDGTNAICDAQVGTAINLIWPLGNGFSIPANPNESVLLVGGGVGVAPLLYLGKALKSNGFKPEFLLAARSASDLLQLDSFAHYGRVYISTDDGTAGEKGLVTQNSTLGIKRDHIYCCGPMPMMKAIGRLCREKGTDCQVSLENVMACGVGACLCCVEKTVKGNRCVCTEGPVFNLNELTW